MRPTCSDSVSAVVGWTLTGSVSDQLNLLDLTNNQSDSIELS